ncbi:DUF1284 domain-containing protein [Aureimonas altamirensis]|uniref:DUF1284 domain-containing protein n=1 Tax=Aureimonas altamirensis TaxID=370622 RepID=UPI0025555AD5|nr:DUF1284 domain-containing protein [Aureimonas altamirensis]
MTIRLRPHHLLCLLTYVGKGYGEAFTRNYDGIAQRLSAGEPILVVEGPDEICAPLLADPDTHCRRPGVTGRDADALRDLAGLLGIEVGDTLSLDRAMLLAMRGAFVAGRTRHACRGCEWEALCSAVARDGFADARVQPAAGGTATMCYGS